MENNLPNHRILRSWEKSRFKDLVGTLEENCSEYFDDLDASVGFEGDNRVSIRFATAAIARRAAWMAACNLAAAWECLQSPIEDLFLSACLIVACGHRCGTVITYLVDGEWVTDRLHEDSTVYDVHITLQPDINGHHPDFMLTIGVKASGLSMGLPNLSPSSILVECDGHDFHEKTKKQAARDKRRDRLFQSKGLAIFRFTGSELHEDAIQCAEEATHALFSRHWQRENEVLQHGRQ